MYRSRPDALTAFDRAEGNVAAFRESEELVMRHRVLGRIDAGRDVRRPGIVAFGTRLGGGDLT